MKSIKKLLKKKDKQEQSPAAAIAQLRGMEDLFVKKQEFLEGKIKQEIETARENGRANRRVALQALRRKKRYETQLKQIDGTLATIEMQREALESANTNTSILATMKSAAEALKNAHHKMKVEDVHNIIDEIAEQQALAKEIADAISSPLASDNLDDEELLRELEEMEQQELDRELLKAPSLLAVPPSLPQVPAPGVPSTSRPKTSDQPSIKSSDDVADDLRKLEEWAS